MPAGDRYVPALGLGCLTPAYDVVVRKTTRERRVKRALLDQSRPESGLTVLDLGTGTGTLAIWVKQCDPTIDVTAVDGDARILALAGRKAVRAAAEVSWVQALCPALPFANDRFDRVLSSLFFHHLSPDAKLQTAREIHRVIKPGGELHVADWGLPTSPVMRGLFLAIQLLDGFANTRDNVTGQLVPLFQRAGFVEVDATRSFDTMFGTLVLYRATKPPTSDR